MSPFYIETKDGIQTYEASELPCDDYDILFKFYYRHGEFSHYATLLGLEADNYHGEKMEIASIRDKDGNFSHYPQKWVINENTGHLNCPAIKGVDDGKPKVIVWMTF